MSQPNWEAQRDRHKKLFEGQYHSAVGKLWFTFKRVLQWIWNRLPRPSKRFSQFMHPLDNMPSFKRLYVQVALWNIFLLVITSLNLNHPAYAGGEGTQLDYLALEETDSSYITDDEGFLIKKMPLEGTAVYDQDRKENISYQVQSGDTISTIAYRFGLSLSSLRYANAALGNSDYLKLGQELVIPPADGVYVKVAKGDSLIKIVEKFKGNLDKTKEFNGIKEDKDLIADSQIFIMDGKPPVTATIAKGGRGNVGGGYSSTIPGGFGNAPENPGGWIKPTEGKITQGYHSGHYAYDIGNRSKPPIWAAAGGTVVKASSGTWGGGYGNHIIIDHGNGYETLYAHCEELYVKVGDSVSQGDVIAKMGRTGRVYGATGIHLHFELWYKGAKLNPGATGAF